MEAHMEQIVLRPCHFFFFLKGRNNNNNNKKDNSAIGPDSIHSWNRVLLGTHKSTIINCLDYSLNTLCKKKKR